MFTGKFKPNLHRALMARLASLGQMKEVREGLVQKMGIHCGNRSNRNLAGSR
jgi:hypothetical protein